MVLTEATVGRGGKTIENWDGLTGGLVERAEHVRILKDLSVTLHVIARKSGKSMEAK